MTLGPFPGVQHTTYVSTVGVYGAIETGKARNLTVMCNSSAGHVAGLDGSLDGIEWAPLRRVMQGAAPNSVVLTAGVAHSLAVQDQVPYVRWNVSSMTDATTLTLMVMGQPVA